MMRKFRISNDTKFLSTFKTDIHRVLREIKTLYRTLLESGTDLILPFADDLKMETMFLINFQKGESIRLQFDCYFLCMFVTS